MGEGGKEMPVAGKSVSAVFAIGEVCCTLVEHNNRKWEQNTESAKGGRQH